MTMTISERITREPALVAELVRALLLLGVVFGLPLTEEQTAAVLLVVGALMAILVRQQVTPAGEVVAQLKPGKHTATAGPAAPVADGAPVHVVRVD